MSEIAMPYVNLGAEPEMLIGDVGGSNLRLADGRKYIEQVENAENLNKINIQIDISTTPENLDRAIDLIAERSAVLLDGRKPDGAGFAIAGEVSDDQETIVRAGPLQKYGWTHQPIKEKVADALGIDEVNVVLVNDAASAGYAEREHVRRSGLLVPDFVGLIETVSSGNGGSIYSLEGAENVEPGHIDSGEEAPVLCGCGGANCIEAHISGNSVAEALGKRLENVPPDDPFWLKYRETFNRMQIVKLEALRDQGYDPQGRSFFGSVVLKGPLVVEGFTKFMTQSEPNIEVTRARYGDHSGLTGTYYAVSEHMRTAQ